MTLDQENEMKEGILSTNNKLDLLTFKVEAYITSDYEWKKTAQPVIELGNNMRGFGKIGAYFIGILAGIGGIMTALIEILKKK